MKILNVQGGGLLVMRLEASDSGTDKVVKAQLEVMFSIPVTKGQPTFSLEQSGPSASVQVVRL